MPTGSKLEEIMNELDRLTQAAGSVEDYMWEIVKLLHDRMLKYNWVGFYMLDRSSSSQAPMLVLANNWKNLPPDPGRISPSRENKISCETRGCGFDFEE